MNYIDARECFVMIHFSFDPQRAIHFIQHAIHITMKYLKIYIHVIISVLTLFPSSIAICQHASVHFRMRTAPTSRRECFQLTIYCLTLKLNFLFTQNNPSGGYICAKVTWDCFINYSSACVVLYFEEVMLSVLDRFLQYLLIAVLVRIIILLSIKQLWRKLQNFSKRYGRTKCEFTWKNAALLHQWESWAYFVKIVPLANRLKQFTALCFPADRFQQEGNTTTEYGTPNINHVTIIDNGYSDFTYQDGLRLI